MNYTDSELAVIIAEYKIARARMSAEAKDEELFEMRAAFGEGEKIIDVFTGEVTYT